MDATVLAPAVRVIVLMVGGYLTGRGLMPQEAVDKLSDLGTITTLLMAVGTLGTAFYGVWNQRKKALVARTAALPDVQKIVTTTTKLANAVPSDKVQVGVR